MKRELKFRIWDEKTNEFLNEFGPNFWHIPYPVDGSLEIEGEANLMDLSFFLNSDDYVIQQFTGLKDKNGKDIYEGDVVILNYSTSDCHYKGLRAVVKWWHHLFVLDIIGQDHFAQDSYKQFEYCEVIGNIMENIKI